MNLPQDSPVHRAQTDGHSWTWTEQILWELLRTNEDNTRRIAHAARQAKGKPKLMRSADWPKFPWVKPDSAPKRIGKIENRSNEDVIEFLDSFG